MTHTATISVDDGWTGPDGADLYGRAAVVRFVERFERASGTSASTTTPGAGSRPLPGIGDALGAVESEQLCEAARRATERYPGPVGDLIARDLEAVAEFGFRFADGTFYRRLVDQLLEPPTSTDPSAGPLDVAATRSPRPARLRPVVSSG